MTIEIIVLALASSIRPTSIAATYALLADHRRRALMCAYVAAGLVFTVAFGMVVVYVFHGIHLNAGTGKTKGIAEIVGGVVALLFGGAVLTGRVHANRSQDAPNIGASWQSRLSGHLTLRTAALAGPVSHIPGLFYLIALNVIVAHHAKVARGTIDVLVYNALWFALAIVALVICFVRPAAAQDAVRSVEQWVRQRSRPILLVVSFGAGVALIVRGAHAA